jgi:hypothetical protein
MKLTINYAILFTIASLGQCVAQELEARWVDPAIELPGVWLYKGKHLVASTITLLSRLHLVVPSLINLGDDGAEPYSFRMDLNDTCHPELADYAGVWIDKDTRPEGYRVGCGYAFQANDCAGTFNSFELDFSGEFQSL